MSRSIQKHADGLPIELPDGTFTQGLRVEYATASTNEYAFKVRKAGANEAGAGVVYHPSNKVGSTLYDGTLFTYNMPGDINMVTAGAIAAGADVWAAADGKIAATGTVLIGRAIESASGADKVIAVIPRLGCDPAPAPPVVNFSIENCDVTVGGTATPVVTVYPTGAKGEITYSSGTTANVTVNANTGVLTAVGAAASTSTITAVCNGISKTFTATVVAAEE